MLCPLIQVRKSGFTDQNRKWLKPSSKIQREKEHLAAAKSLEPDLEDHLTGNASDSSSDEDGEPLAAAPFRSTQPAA